MRYTRNFVKRSMDSPGLESNKSMNPASKNKP